MELARIGMVDEGVRTNAADRAVRGAWNAVASDVARLFPDMTAEAPLDRAVLAAFVEMVKDSGDGLVAEVGCGSGRVTAHLADAALRIVGPDLSLGMATVARSAHPDLAFAVAHAGALPIRSGALGGLVAWYSLINLPTDLLPAVLAEFARVMQPGAPVVIAFQCGEGERVDRTTAYGHGPNDLLPPPHRGHGRCARGGGLRAARDGAPGAIAGVRVHTAGTPDGAASLAGIQTGG